METIQNSGRFVIDPGDYRTSRGAIGILVVWLTIWVSLTALITLVAFDQHTTLISLWLVFAFLAALLVLFTLFNRKRKQILEVSGDSLVVRGSGILPSSKKCIEKQDLKALTLERRVSGTTRESIYTLNLLRKSGFLRNRIILGNFMHPEDLAVLLEEIRVFLQKSGFMFDVKNTWTNEDNS